MPYKDQDKAKESNKQRQKRYRDTHQSNTQPKLEITPITPNVTPNVTPVISKSECNCRYYRLTDGLLVCIQCGRPAPVRKDGWSRGLANGSPWLR